MNRGDVMGKLVPLSSQAAGDAKPNRHDSKLQSAGTPPPDQSDNTELPQIVGVLKRRWKVIAGCAMLLTLLAATVIFQLTPRYTAESTVMLDTRKTQVVDIQAVVSGLQSDAAVVRSELEVLKSPDLARRVAQKLNLVTDKNTNPALMPVTFWSRVDPIGWIKGLYDQ